MFEAQCPEEELLWPIAVDEDVAPDVRQHLESCSTCRLRIRRMQSEIATLRKAVDESSVAIDAKTAKADITHIDRYQIVSKLSEGGQAEVFRAVDPNLSQEVVVKLGKKRLDGEHDRIVKEGRLLAELDHPNLARVFDLGFYEDQPYLVLKYVRGVGVADYVKNEQLAPESIASLMAKVARAAAAAHHIGVLHQDIKPDNIVVDESGNPLLIDFGMALLRSAWQDETTDLDAIGGTPAFMAPEQARGEPDQLGPAADTFALGATLYSLLTDKAPFAANSVEQSLTKACRCDFDKQALKRVNVPARLEHLCLEAMHGDHKQRPALNAWADKLETFAQGSRANSLLLWGSAAALLLLAVATILAIGVSSSAPSETGDENPGTDLRSVIAPVSEDPVSEGIEDAAVPQVEPGVIVESRRTKAFYPLVRMVPLRKGDALQIRGTTPKNFQTSVFMIDEQGVLGSLNSGLQFHTTDTTREFTYPSPGTVSKLDDASGTVLLIVCAGPGDAATEADIRACLTTETKWPELPPDSTVEFDHHHTWISQSRSLIITQAPEKPLVDRAEDLRQRLQEKFEFVYGIAFTHGS